MIRVTAFRWVPPFARGQVRDLRVRWALEEAGLSYEERLIGPDDQRSADYRKQQPFGQVPVYEEDDLVLFESGAIVLHVAEKSEVLMPVESRARARVRAWLFAALNSIEPMLMNVAQIQLFFPDEEWAKLRRPGAIEAAMARLNELSTWLGDAEYLEGHRFTAADLLMTTVLRIAHGTGLLAELPSLDAYRLRAEARPAFQRALAAQLAAFSKK